MRLITVGRSATPLQRAAFGVRARSSGILGSHPVASPRWNSRHQPANVTALAILLPRRGYASDPSSSTDSGSPSSFPPPGFNAEQAKKPLPKDVADRASETPGGTDAATSSTQSNEPNKTKTDVDGKQLSSVDVETAEKQAVEGKKGLKKLTLGQKFKKEVRHYWDGTKLLAAEVRISTTLALKMAAGYELSRREHKQLQRTTRDLARLVPFSVFVIIPFAELLLPVALKLFPNLLPSTYEAQKSKDAKAATLQDTRKEVSSFLRNTMSETGLPMIPKNAKKEEFAEFFRKVRATGESPSAEDVIKVCKIFKDDLTLDNLSRPQLVAICRYLNLNTFGTDAMLRYHIRHHMRQIKRDDKAISFEGVDSLLVTELQNACASRGLMTLGMSPGRLRDDLSMWLDLRLKQGVPSTLLVLSNAYMYAQQRQDYEISFQIDALRSVLSSIPEELFHEIELEVHNAEGAATNKQRLEVIKEQQELIEEENEQNTEHEETGASTLQDHQDIDDKDDKSVEAAQAQAKSQPEADVNASPEKAQESQPSQSEKTKSQETSEKQ